MAASLSEIRGRVAGGQRGVGHDVAACDGGSSDGEYCRIAGTDRRRRVDGDCLAIGIRRGRGCCRDRADRVLLSSKGRHVARFAAASPPVLQARLSCRRRLPLQLHPRWPRQAKRRCRGSPAPSRPERQLPPGALGQRAGARPGSTDNRARRATACGRRGRHARQLDSGDAHGRLASMLIFEGKTTEAAGQLNQATTCGTRLNVRRASRASRASRTAVAETAKPQSRRRQYRSRLRATGATNIATGGPAASAGAAAESVSRDRGRRQRICSRPRIARRRSGASGVSRNHVGAGEGMGAVLPHASFTAGHHLDQRPRSQRIERRREAGRRIRLRHRIGKSEHQPVSFQASFRREGTAWQLVSVH